MSIDTLVNNIVKWGTKRGITVNGDPQTQGLKLVSEVGELADNLAKKRYIDAQDDIGDIIVVLVMISELISTDIKTCLQVAYDDIKDRKGFLNENGVFIKEGDNGN